MKMQVKIDKSVKSTSELAALAVQKIIHFQFKEKKTIKMYI